MSACTKSNIEQSSGNEDIFEGQESAYFDLNNDRNNEFLQKLTYTSDELMNYTETSSDGKLYILKTDEQGKTSFLTISDGSEKKSIILDDYFRNLCLDEAKSVFLTYNV